ncbi:hypothetical protein QQZ08_003745 [Neonectria magnoliae]|uniref:Uncharacterized protein n=1 Tax=Neonectria magnoliae TaxID=2732573 RepID=A0ABR1I914_9HYPO
MPMPLAQRAAASLFNGDKCGEGTLAFGEPGPFSLGKTRANDKGHGGFDGDGQERDDGVQRDWQGPCRKRFVVLDGEDNYKAVEGRYARDYRNDFQVPRPNPTK